MNQQLPLTYKVTITNYLTGKKFSINDVVADGYIDTDSGLRFFVTDKGVRYEMKVEAGVVIQFAKERDVIIRASEKKEQQV